jgi:hypothetical protein
MENNPMTSENPNAPREENKKTNSPQNATSDKDPKTDKHSPIPSQIIPSHKYPHGSYQCRYEPTPRWMRYLEAAGVLAVIAYAVITYFMWRDSHKNFVVDQRAWLSTGVVIPNPIKEGLRVEATVLVKNTGKTTAKQIRSEWNIVILRDADSVKFDYVGSNATIVGVLPPNEIIPTSVYQFTEPYMPRLLTKEQTDDLNNGRTYFVVYGRGIYYDVFGEVHWFHVCNWRSFYSGAGVYMAENCTAYNDSGDGNLPEKQ